MVRLIHPFLLAAALVLAPCCSAHAAEEEPHPVETELIALHKSLKQSAGDEQLVTEIGVLFRLKPGWHIYWKNSGESAIPTRIDWRLSNGWQAGELKWPAPLQFVERGDITTFGYKREVLLAAEMRASAPNAYANGDVRIEAEAAWLVCKDVCIPGKASLTAEIPLNGEESKLSEQAALFQRYEAQLAATISRWRQLSGNPSAKLTVLPAHLSVQPGGSTSVALSLSGLHLAGDAAPAHLQVFPDPPKELEALTSQAASLGDRSAVLILPVESAAGAKEGVKQLEGIVVLSAKAAGAEGDIALPWSVELAVAAGEPAPNPEYEALLEDAGEPQPAVFRRVSQKSGSAPPNAVPQSGGLQIGFLLALLFGFIGGMLLNLMPCVLPIIGIKVMGFVGHAGQESRGAKLNAAAFSAGILSTFLVLALLIISLRSFGFHLGWGFQFQHPEFVLGLTIVLFVLSLGFFDLYTVTLPFLGQTCRAVDELRPTLSKHFFEGVLATVLSTPCTAPFLGTALVFAFTQPPVLTIAVFLSIGLGLALPYFYLSTHPKLINRLPKPGPWMDKVRQLMGFFLLGTVVWLLFVLHSLSGTGSLWCLLLLLVVLFCMWLFDWARAWRSTGARRAAQFAAAVFLLASFLWLYPGIVQPAAQQSTPAHGKIPWQRYSDARLEQVLSEGRSAFIDFTADWCITCKANEMLIINTDGVAEAIERSNIVPMIADWTTGEVEITDALNRYGGSGVPLYVVVPHENPDNPIVLSTIPSKASLIAALDQVSMDSAFAENPH